MQPQESDVETTDGFYAVFGRYDIKDDGKTVFLLDDSGTRLCGRLLEAGWHPVEGIWCIPEPLFTLCV